jgi:hypothetical protein
MIVKETAYLENTARIEVRPNVIPTMIQLTPINYFRYNTDKYPDDDYDREPMDLLDQIYSQIKAEFLNYSDFNKLTEEKYIKIL